MINQLSKLSVAMVFAASANTAGAADPAPDPRLGAKPPRPGSAASSSSLPRLRDDPDYNRNVRGEPAFGKRREDNGRGGYRWGRTRQ